MWYTVHNKVTVETNNITGCALCNYYCLYESNCIDNGAAN